MCSVLFHRYNNLHKQLEFCNGLLHLLATMAHNLADGFILQHDPINVKPPLIKH